MSESKKPTITVSEDGKHVKVVVHNKAESKKLIMQMVEHGSEVN